MKKTTLAVALILAVAIVTSVSSMALAYGGRNYASQGSYQELNAEDRITEPQAREIATNYLQTEELTYTLADEAFETRRAFVYKLEQEEELQGSLRVNAYDRTVTFNECDEECDGTCTGEPSQARTFNRKELGRFNGNQANSQAQGRGNMRNGRGCLITEETTSNQPS